MLQETKLIICYTHDEVIWMLCVKINILVFKKQKILLLIQLFNFTGNKIDLKCEMFSHHLQ